MFGLFNKMNRVLSSRSPRGFSLVELLVTMAITGIIMSGVYGVYFYSVHASKAEEKRVDIQQGLRFATELLMSQLRHAGYDKQESIIPTIVAAGQNYIYFTADFNDDSDVNDDGEHIVFCIYTDADGEKQLGMDISDGDANGDGTFSNDDIAANIDPDKDGIAELNHTHGSSISHQPVIAVEEIEFYYTLNDGTQTTDEYGDPADLIRAVDFAILARSVDEDPRYAHPATATYDRPSGAAAWTGYSDGRRRRLMSATIRFRNMGL